MPCLVWVSFLLATIYYVSWRQEEKEKLEFAHKKEFEKKYESSITDADGNVYNYTVCNRNMGRMFAAVGGAF